MIPGLMRRPSLAVTSALTGTLYAKTREVLCCTRRGAAGSKTQSENPLQARGRSTEPGQPPTRGSIPELTTTRANNVRIPLSSLRKHRETPLNEHKSTRVVLKSSSSLVAHAEHQCGGWSVSVCAPVWH